MDRYIGVMVYYTQREESRFEILDASNIAADPIASIVMPQPVPVGLHGIWCDDFH